MTQHFALPIEVPVEAIRLYCQEKPILRLGLFGSVLREDFSPDSDVDLLVEYEFGAKITLFDMAKQEIDLSAIFERKVDLRTAKELSPYFREEVQARARWVYER